MTDIAGSRLHLPPGLAETLLHVTLAVVAIIVAVSAFAISVPFGILATFLLSALMVFVMPASAVAIVIASFLLQNMVVAWYTPYIGTNDTFDTMRGANFVILMAVFGMFLAAALQPRFLSNPAMRRWMVIGVAVGSVVMVYLGLGIVRGLPKDAIIYFRNIVTPVACFYIALIAASTWRIDLARLVTICAGFAVAYGYLELIFTMDFLSLFHGDEYVKLDIWRQIQSGMWEKALEETGFVLRNLEDVMTTNAFNLAMFDGVLPKVFRIGGPNFHSIAYAYALAIFAAWLMFSGRWLLPLLAFPLILIIGSKGALVMFVLLVLARIATAMFGPRFALGGVIFGCMLWVAASILVGGTSDYHVLGLFAGLREFISNPIGQGLGFGGNLSSTTVDLDWQQAQMQGAASIPLESAFGVLIYQMGIMSISVYGLLFLIARACWRAFRYTGDRLLFFPVIGIISISANSILQEEAFFSPLALGLMLLLGGVALGNVTGTHFRPGAPIRNALPAERA
ncbi:hypothetical protein GCM10007989_03310 [Devosia pacifica]|uniref:Uncharacterized protein n=1 Tax=Devosia pacifica TaxID=1335967 RepID=A0A918RTH2_9HYPH|nr:hypothetical protein [Devosia pacifica]GHA12211.1 hypothetical protein GCM10007989_03310 [Devosia pacifica]